MNSNSTQLDVFRDIIEKYGREIMEEAVRQVLDSDYSGGIISSASKYHARFLRKVIPLFPALTSLSCAAVGGRMEKQKGIGVALTLFVEAANLHDDLIDHTTIKYSKETAYGKFGGDAVLLAGDVVLVQGALLLCKECESLPAEQKKAILDITFRALTEISKSAAKEAGMRRKIDVSSKDYLEVIRLRASVPEALCKIGAILGGGTETSVSALGCYGKTYGVVGTIVDEFMDLRDYGKFSSRLRNECLPLPILSALENKVLKNEITSLLDEFDVSEKDVTKLVTLVMNSNEVQKLKHETSSQINNGLKKLKTLKVNMAVRDLALLLETMKGLLHTVG